MNRRSFRWIRSGFSLPRVVGCNVHRVVALTVGFDGMVSVLKETGRNYDQTRSSRGPGLVHGDQLRLHDVVVPGVPGGP